MSVNDFLGFFAFLLSEMASFWNMFTALSIGGIPWTRWLLLFVGASVVLGIIKHSISDAGGVTVSSTVNTAKGGSKS